MALGCWLRSGVPFMGEELPGALEKMSGKNATRGSWRRY